MYRLVSVVLAIALVLFATLYTFNVNLFASETVVVDSKQILTEEEVKQKLTQRLQGIQITDVSLSPMEGFYQVFFGSQILYVSYDGNFIFTGNLLNLSGPKLANLTNDAIDMKAAELAPQRAATIAALKETDMVVFKADDEKYKITVFTDVDCAYCRKLHKEMPQLNKLGITVRYLAFPRAGLGSSSYHKLVSVWCADDRQQAMNNAKLERKFIAKTCENPVASQYGLTREFGLSGTPAIILDDGELLAGYLPAQRLAEHLNNKAAAATATN